MRTRAYLCVWGLSPLHTHSVSLSLSFSLSLSLSFLPVPLLLLGTGKRSSSACWWQKCRRRQRRQIVCWVSWGLNVCFVSLFSSFLRSLVRARARALLHECQRCLVRMLTLIPPSLSSLDDALCCSSSKQDDHRWKAFLGVRWVYLRWCGMDPFFTLSFVLRVPLFSSILWYCADVIFIAKIYSSSL